MAIDRSSIQRSDFPTARRGYDPAAVDQHLRDVADQLESARRPAGQPVAAAASAQVQRIIEAAAATGWLPERRVLSTWSATSRRCRSTAAGS